MVSRRKLVRNKVKPMKVTHPEQVKEVYVFLFLGLLTLFIMSIMASNNSPLIQYIGADSGIYLLIGVLTLYNTPRKAIAYSVYGILGLLTIIVPLLLYHYSQHTLAEMFNATLLHNLRYSKVGLEQKRWSIFLDSSFKIWRFGMFSVIAYGFIHCQIYKDRLYGYFLGLSALLVYISVSVGLLNGTSQNTMSPQKELTRAEMMTVLIRLDKMLK